jgi:integrase
MKLTKTAIDQATAKGEKDAFLWCSELPRFGVRVTPTGRKTYVVRYRNAEGASRMLTIARACDMPPQQARELAREVFSRVAKGDDPSSERSELRSGARMSDLRERYDREHTQPYKKPSTRRRDETIWRNHIIPALGDRAIAGITTNDIQQLHASLKHIPTTANRTVCLLSHAFKFARRVGWYNRENPVRDVRRYKERQRDRVLSKEEISAFLAEVHNPARHYSESVRRMFTLLLMTGARLSEIKDARLEWIDRQRCLLVLPDSKTGQRRISLPEPAMAIVEALPRSGWLCPNTTGEKPINSPRKAFVTMCERAGIEGVRIHDLRHTVGSWAHKAGLSQREIADLLGHRHLSTTARYIHSVGVANSVVEKMLAA